jgi:hypothetical protein
VTDIEVINMGLHHCGAKGISSLNDTVNEAKVAKTWWQTAMDTVLLDRDWTFARDRIVLAKDAAAPAFGFAFRHIIPTTVIKVQACFDGSLKELDDWVREGGYVLTDNDAPVYAEVVIRPSSTLWSGPFCQALGAKFGEMLAVPLTENRQLRLDLGTLYERYVKEAGASDGQQGRSRRKTVPKMAGRRR